MRSWSQNYCRIIRAPHDYNATSGTSVSSVILIWWHSMWNWILVWQNLWYWDGDEDKLRNLISNWNFCCNIKVIYSCTTQNQCTRNMVIYLHNKKKNRDNKSSFTFASGLIFSKCRFQDSFCRSLLKQCPDYLTWSLLFFVYMFGFNMVFQVIQSLCLIITILAW